MRSLLVPRPALPRFPRTALPPLRRVEAELFFVELLWVELLCVELFLPVLLFEAVLFFFFVATVTRRGCELEAALCPVL